MSLNYLQHKCDWKERLS